MHFKYAHSAKLVEVLINKFIFSVVSNPPPLIMAHYVQLLLAAEECQQNN